MLLFIFLAFTATFVTSLPPQNELDAICEITNVCSNSTNVCSIYVINPIITCSDDLSTIIKLGVYQRADNGTLPTSIGELRNLVRLNFNGNEMNGTIPTQIGNLTSLEYLLLSYNKFEGTIPTQFLNLKNLTHLGLSATFLGGTIPTYIGNITSLHILELSGDQYLSIARPQFSGIIPTQIGYLINLNELDLSRNKLSGTIPIELENLKNLTSLNLKYNMLSGTIPLPILNLNLKKLEVDSAIKCPILIFNTKPNEILLKTCDNIQIKVEEDISLNGTISFSNITITNESTLSGKDLDLSTQTMELSPNTKVQLTNSIITVSGNTTISSLNLILDNENRNQPAISTKGCLNIQPNTELNVTFSKGLPQTNQNLFSFACKTGNFSRVQVNGQTACDFVLSSNFATLSPCTGTGSGEEKTINLFSFVFLLFIYYVFLQ